MPGWALESKHIAVTSTFLAELCATALIHSLLLQPGSMQKFSLISLPAHPNAGPDLTYAHLGEVLSNTGPPAGASYFYGGSSQASLL